MNAKTTIKTKTEPKTLLFCNSKRKKLIQKIAENFVEAGLILKEERLRGLRGQEGLRDKPECIDGGFRQCCRSNGREDVNVDFPNSMVYGRIWNLQIWAREIRDGFGPNPNPFLLTYPNKGFGFEPLQIQFQIHSIQTNHKVIYTLSSRVRKFFQEEIFWFLFYIRKLNNKRLKIRFKLLEHGMDQERWNRTFGRIARRTFVWAFFFFFFLETRQNFIKLRNVSSINLKFKNKLRWKVEGGRVKGWGFAHIQVNLLNPLGPSLPWPKGNYFYWVCLNFF